MNRRSRPPRDSGRTKSICGYDLGVTDRPFHDMKQLVDFCPSDALALAELSDPIRPHLDDVVDGFYARLFKHSNARAVFRQGDEQITRVRQTLCRWLRELFCGQYDDAYFEKRAEIGRTHVHMEVPERYTIISMNFIREALTRHIRAIPLPNPNERISALNKLLDLELMVITDTYREQFVARIQRIDKARYMRRLSESEHLASIGQLAASLAHEIKNPLAGISGAIQVLGADLPPGHPHKEAVDEALRQIDRLDATVRDLLVYARPQAPTREDCDLREIVERALILLREEPAFRDVQFGCPGANSDAVAHVDEHQLQQVVMNLMLNAADACGRDGEVICRVVPHEDCVEIDVEDNGSGMGPETIERAFDPFYTTKVRGTGLGLPICKRIVEAHGGSIRIESAEGQGTRVILELPRSP